MCIRPTPPPLTALDYLTFALAAHADTFMLTLRDIAQVTTILEACFLTLHQERIHIFFLVFLAATYQRDPVTFRKISSTKSISGTRLLSDLVEPSGAGQIKITTQRTNHYESVGTYNISMREIAEIYLEKLQLTDGSRVNALGFPGHNFVNSDFDITNGKYKAKFANYFSIIQQAGGFLLKK
jgi:hypothetical protein